MCCISLKLHEKKQKPQAPKMSTVKSSIDDEPQREPDAKLDKRGVK